MGSIDLPKSPNVFHPEKPSAVGSRNSLAQEYRDQQFEVDQLLSEEVDKVMNHINSKLPKEVLERLDVMGGVKEKLYNYFNQNYQNMFNRYIVTSEDEMVKKVRNFIDKEETKTLARYTPKEISQLLEQVGGADKFNTGEIEKSMINMYGHLQGHIQRGVNDLENLTNSLLRQKTDVGAFIRGENAYSIVKCAFKDSLLKPKTVAEIKLSVNILDSELISPIFHYQATVEYLIKELLAKHVIDEIDHEIDKLRDTLLDEGKEELRDSEIIFEKMKRATTFTSDDKENPKSRRYDIIAKDLMDRIVGLRAEIDPAEYDQMNVRETIKRVVDIENIRNRGYNTAINSITAILDTSKMGYQYIENLKNARELILRDYEDTDFVRLPDERYQIRLRYYDNAQLINEQRAYDLQLKSFELEIQHLWDVLEMVYFDSKFFKKISDFSDLAKIYKSKISTKIKKRTGDPLYEDLEKVWDEITFIDSSKTDVEKLNRTCIFEKGKLKKMLVLIRERLQSMYSYRYPIERRVMEERVGFLEKEFNRFDYMINPYHVQAGLLLDIDITSIKRKNTTVQGMAGVLNEFLHGVSKGFQDAAFASFSRRRSTVREDIAQSFSAPTEEEKGAGNSPSADYLQMLSEGEQAPVALVEPSAQGADQVKKSGSRSSNTGLVDNSKSKKARKVGGNKRSNDNLSEI